MSRVFLVCLFLATISSCNEQPIDIEHLNGYWEIDEVILKEGTKRDYSINTTVDFFELISDSTGIRKKVNPRLDGTFMTSKDAERIKIKREDQGVFIYYNTPMMEYREEIIELNENSLVLLNGNSIRYIYKRFKSILE